MDNAELYIELYKKLEEAVRSTYGLSDGDSISYYLSKQNEYRRYRDDLKYCQEVRNLLSHKRKLNDRFAVEPSEEMINFIKSLTARIRDRKKCSDVCVKIGRVYSQPFDGKVKAAMKVMREKEYTYVPVTDGGKVIGVFDENSVFRFLTDSDNASVDDRLTFRDMEKYISLTDREFDDFMFVKGNVYVDELENRVEKAFALGRRIGMVFVTGGGRQNDTLQGLITLWDIIANNG